MPKLELKYDHKKETCVDIAKTHHVYLTETDEGFVKDDKRLNNILIEGENYHALKALQYTHPGKIRVIIIDAPYNTGNDSWVYRDRYGDNDDRFIVKSDDKERHSKWLSMMESRLVLARTLIDNQGCIFIHCDHHELRHVWCLCDQVFGEDNFINDIIWVYENSTMKNPSNQLASKHEYILCFAKNKDQFELNKVREDVVSEKLIKRFGKYADADGKILFKNVQNEQSYLSRIVPKFVKENGREPKDDDVIDVLQGNYIRDVINIPACRTNELKSKYDIDFEYPKPVALEKILLKLASQKNSIILDFFAGSGTTGEAVAELNKEDGGSRQFILITNNETSEKLPNGICKDATLPRLTKSIGNENLKVLKVSVLKKEGEHPSDHIDQLVEGNKLLPILKLQYNTFTEVETTKEYVILTNHDKSFYLGVYHDDIAPNRKLFQSKLDGYNINNHIEVNRYDEYAQKYLRVISKKG